MKLFFLATALICWASISAQNFNRPVPQGFTPYEFEQFNTSYNGHYFLAARKAAGMKCMGILDKDGYIVWATMNAQSFFDFKYNAANNVFLYTAGLGATKYHVRMDTSMNPIDTIVPQGYWGDIHEQLLTDDGHTFIIATKDTVMDLSAYTFSGSTGSVTTTVRGNVIQEFDDTGALVWEWKTIHHIHPEENYDGFPYDETGFDYAHVNSIELDHDGHVLLSLRSLCSVMKINHNTGQVMWRLGGENSDFTFTNGLPFYGQHDFRYHPSRGTYSIHDNAFGGIGSPESRSIEYVLDTVNWTATEAWTYTYDWPITAHTRGNHHINTDGFHLINWGDTRRPEPTFTLTDDAKNKVSDLHLEDEFIAYRSYAEELPFEFDRPTITCDNSSGLTLTASPGLNYLWSTGETTQSITVSTPGTYVVWEQKGIGLAGSQPFIVTDVSTACQATSIESVQPKTKQEIEVIFDLSGRVVNAPKRGGFYLVRYMGGEVRKVVWE